LLFNFFIYMEAIMSDESSSKIGWFVAGLGLGTIAALLYAPKSGRDTRQAIAQSVGEGRDYLAGVTRDARDQVSDWVDTGKKVISRQKDQATGAIHDAAVATANATGR
jgi:gas vesicle protein